MPETLAASKTPASARVITSRLRRLLGVPTFHPGATTALCVGSWDVRAATARDAIVNAYERHGFALVEGPCAPDEDDLQALATSLHLGDVFTPPVYAGQAHTTGTGITRLSAPPDPAKTLAPQACNHPAFQSNGAQNWHTDGTLQPIGQVATSILLCRRPAVSGGESLMFNATGAFVDLAATDPDAARTLMHPHVLIRTSNLPGTTAHSCTGPAFTTKDSDLLTRYSMTSTEHYDSSTAHDPQALQRGLDFLHAAAQPGKHHYLEFTLTEHQGLILANDRLSHARRAWIDDPDHPRDMLRALFTRRPSSAPVICATAQTHA